MTVITFPPKRRPLKPGRDDRRCAEAVDGAWRDERARLHLVAALQRSLVEGLLARGAAAEAVLRAFR